MSRSFIPIKRTAISPHQLFTHISHKNLLALWTIKPITTKRTTNYPLKSLNTKRPWHM